MSPDSEKGKKAGNRAKSSTAEAGSKKTPRKTRTAEARSEDPALPIAQTQDVARPAADALEAEIRRRAYELYVSRGGVDGDEISDWLEAERIVRGSA